MTSATSDTNATDITDRRNDILYEKLLTFLYTNIYACREIQSI